MKATVGGEIRTTSYYYNRSMDSAFINNLLDSLGEDFDLEELENEGKSKQELMYLLGINESDAETIRQSLIKLKLLDTLKNSGN